MDNRKYELILIAVALIIVAVILGYQAISSPIVTPVTAPSGVTSELFKDIITEQQKVNINTAGVDILMSLDGIGEKKAEAIVAYRNNNGSFKDISDVMKVEGITQSVYDKIYKYIEV